MSDSAELSFEFRWTLSTVAGGKAFFSEDSKSASLNFNLVTMKALKTIDRKKEVIALLIKGLILDLTPIAWNLIGDVARAMLERTEEGNA